MVVALAFPPSAVDGSNSKLRCGPARSWLSQGLSSSFMTCGEVYCKGGFCMRLGTQTTALLVLELLIKDPGVLELYCPRGLLSWSIRPRMVVLIG
jgi:hypothetical protein